MALGTSEIIISGIAWTATKSQLNPKQYKVEEK